MNLNLVVFFNFLLFGSYLSINANGVGASNKNFRDPNFNITEFFEKYEGRLFNLQIANWTEILEFPDSIYIPSYRLFLELITKFGERINRISIIRSSEIDEDDWTVLFQRINEHCSDSLTSLVLESVKEFTFKNITNSFNKVEELLFSIKANESGSKLPLDVLFPNLQSLRIDYYNSVDNITNNGTRFIDFELPAMANLRAFSTYANARNPFDVATIKKQLGNMFEKNPQIQTLWYGPFMDDFIQEIRKHLPNLQVFAPHRIDANIQPVHFDSVKYFISSSLDQPGSVDKISFSHLDTLKMYYDPTVEGGKVRDTWMAFFKNHQNLRKLYCDSIKKDGFVEFIAELPNLHEISITSYEIFNIDFVTELIEGANNWSKFHYNANPVSYSGRYPNMEPFIEKFGNKWNITYNFDGRPFVDLEKKN